MTDGPERHETLTTNWPPSGAAQDFDAPLSTDGDAASRGEGQEAAAASAGSQLISSDQAAALRWRWESIQEGFVDAPRAAVAEADALIVEAIARLNEVCTDKRASLGGQWGASIGASTEDLRLTLQRYRQLLDRLLSL